MTTPPPPPPAAGPVFPAGTPVAPVAAGRAGQLVPPPPGPVTPGPAIPAAGVAPTPVPAPARGAAPAAAKVRISGVDVARAVAIIGMLVAHLGTGHHASGGGWGEQWMWIFDGRSSALFATLAGVSIALMSRRARGLGPVPPLAPGPLPPQRVAWRSVRVKIAVRAAILLPIGIALQALGTPVVIILPTYAVLFFMALPVLRLSTRWLVAIIAAAVTIGPLVVLGLREATTGTVQPSLVEFGFGVGELVWGYYPALVWIGYLLAGLVMGRGNLASPRYAATLLGLGTALAAVGYGLGVLLQGVWANSAYAPDYLFWPDVLVSTEPHAGSTFEVVGNLGVAVAVTGLCLLLTTPRIGATLLWPLATAGAMSLTIYAGQIVVIAILGPMAVFYPESNVPLLALALGSIVFACVWRPLLGQGPLERLLKLASDAAARRTELRAQLPPPPGWVR
ncbi:heparan-alpha-glucosaminide N-acetyltransferase domain-containing protein [Salana multivorans]|uniref:heparan-alpha-glucosaminide N-acetyltransferase domain-containing protein n=1 Tax=Salana multivorans TaxID=120377 RepID=UPI0024929616|nr:heparan-alpha-glucosaminide N-acetyltransferase domain-containing protein [Salana multivorans]